MMWTSKPASLVGRGCSVRHRRPHVSHTDDTCYLIRVSSTARRPSFTKKKRKKKKKEEEKKKRRRKNRGEELLYSFFSSFFLLLPLLFLSETRVVEGRRTVEETLNSNYRGCYFFKQKTAYDFDM